MNGKRILKLTGLVCGSIATVYLISFVVVFQMFGCPSRTRTHWLGPTPRQDDGAIDIGKVYEWGEEGEAPVPISFTVFHPLCKGWLLMNGLRD